MKRNYIYLTNALIVLLFLALHRDTYPFISQNNSRIKPKSIRSCFDGEEFCTEKYITANYSKCIPPNFRSLLDTRDTYHCFLKCYQEQLGKSSGSRTGNILCNNDQDAAFKKSLQGLPPKQDPNEGFTVVMMTMDRDRKMLLDRFQQFKTVTRLKKIVLVWNNLNKTSSNLTLPDIGKPIAVVNSKRNSLMNRFVPYDEVETEGVLSLDDDIDINSTYVDKAFSVWQENRDRLVGPYARYHEYVNGTWKYLDGEQMSIMLTGFAFYHKFFGYLYTYHQPQQIRDYVDDHMNCEDISMNFMAAYVTGKQPVRVAGAKINPLCDGCKRGLSGRENHYVHRADCLKDLVKIYKTMPLKVIPITI